jgi:hypothetical protein
MKKQYKLIKGSGGAANGNTISIEHYLNKESLVFVSKVREKAIELFGNGASLNSIGTTYGVHIRYDDEKKNRRIANFLTKIIEFEYELKALGPQKKEIIIDNPVNKKYTGARVTFFCKNEKGYHRIVDVHPYNEIFTARFVEIPKSYIVDHIKVGGSNTVWHSLEKEATDWLEVTRAKEIDDELEKLDGLL